MTKEGSNTQEWEHEIFLIELDTHADESLDVEMSITHLVAQVHFVTWGTQNLGLRHLETKLCNESSSSSHIFFEIAYKSYWCSINKKEPVFLL